MERTLTLKSLLEEDNKIFEHNCDVAKYKPMLSNLRNTQLSTEGKKSALVVYDCVLNNVLSGDEEKSPNPMDGAVLKAVMKFYEQFDDVKVPKCNEIASDNGQLRNVKSFLREQLDFENISEHATSEYNTSKNIGEHLENKLNIADEEERNSIMVNITQYITTKPKFENKNYQIPKELSDMLMKTCSECAKEGKNVPDCKDLATNEDQFWAVRKWFRQKFCCIRKINEIAKRDLANNIYRFMFVPRKLGKSDENSKKSNPLELDEWILTQYDPDVVEDVLKDDARKYTDSYRLEDIINASDFGEMSIDEIETIIRHNLDFGSVCKKSYLLGKHQIEHDTEKLFNYIETISTNFVNQNPKMILDFYYRLVPKIMKLSEEFDFKQWAKDLSIPRYENADYDSQDLDYRNKRKDFQYLYTNPYTPKFNLVYKFLLSRMDDKNNLTDQNTLSVIPKKCTDILREADIPDCMKKIFEALDNFSEFKTSIANNMDDLVRNLNTVIKFMYKNQIITGQEPDLLNDNSFDVGVVDKIYEFFRVIIFGFNFSKLFDNEYSIASSAKLAKFKSYLKTKLDASEVSPFGFLDVAKQIVPKQEPEENNINKINIE